MKEEAIAIFDYAEELKEKLIELVVYQNYSKEEVAKKYGLVNTYILTNWIIGYKKKLEKGAVTSAPMEKPKTKDAASSAQRHLVLSCFLDTGTQEMVNACRSITQKPGIFTEF
ncbi:transposase [Pedobacter deserti]|uniref:transposase n=1 Tax=Pedobacter deserti TaxID=2817382 RepID=UPI00210C6C9C|nr:transposase [Pedobacter sp. SYSU D00382]